MYKIRLINGKAVIDGLTRADKNVKAGAADGILLATNDLAEDVARHTPKKTGKARESVVPTVSKSGTVGKVTYDYRKRGAFYMRFILLGAKRHQIGLRLKTARGLAQAQRIADRKAGKLGRPVAAKVNRKRALAFVIGGRLIFRARVIHKGLKAKHILTDRLAANRTSITNTINRSITKRVSVFGR